MHMIYCVMNWENKTKKKKWSHTTLSMFLCSIQFDFDILRFQSIVVVAFSRTFWIEWNQLWIFLMLPHNFHWITFKWNDLRQFFCRYFWPQSITSVHGFQQETHVFIYLLYCSSKKLWTIFFSPSILLCATQTPRRIRFFWKLQTSYRFCCFYLFFKLFISCFFSSSSSCLCY